ncbi:MAG: S8 family serine peptidase [Thermomicrobiales bacterium]
MRRRAIAGTILVLAQVLSFYSLGSVAAFAPGNEYFERTWARTDQPVAGGAVSRTWMWGPEANSDIIEEEYAESPGNMRAVQYYDKSRMEITNPDATVVYPWFVTNGLLVVEMVEGNMQVGDASFVDRPPAAVNVTGDPSDETGLSPTYADIDRYELRSRSPLPIGSTITQRIDGEGMISDDPSLAQQNVTAAERVQVPTIDHSVASVFWTFMNATGTVYEDGQYIEDLLFIDPFYATGYPITEAYWSRVPVAGTERDVLWQCFERRCLTYTPGNPEGFLVEAGNVGQHYYAWRYETDEDTGDDDEESAFKYEIDETISYGNDELPGLDGGPARTVGTMVGPDGNRDDFAENEVTMAFRNQQELDDFLTRYNGTVLRSGVSQPIEGISPEDYEPESSGLYLIQVDPELSGLDDLDENMVAAGIEGEFRFSSENAARLIAILARERDKPIGPNIVMRGDAVSEHPQTGGGNLDAESWPWMNEDDDLNQAGDQGLSVGVTHAWDYLSYQGVPPSAGPDGGSSEWNPTYVAVIDSGFALDEDTGVPLDGNQDYFYYGSKPIQADFVDSDGTAGGENRTSCSGGSTCPWHGTGSYGVMGAVPRNSFGTAGSGGPVVVPILIKVDWTWYGAVEGMYNLADAIRSSQFFGGGSKRASVVTISISGSCYTACGISEAGGIEDFHDYMQRTVDTAVTFGGIVVASSGNSGLNLDNPGSETGWSATIPCELDHVICVGAVERDKQAKGYSNYGNNVDMWAPTDLLSTTSPASLAMDSNDTCDPGSSNVMCDELYRFGGTSAATPFLAGIIALMNALDENATEPGVIPAAGTGRVEAIQDILQDTANPSPDPKVTTGYVDAYRAVEAVRGNQPPSVTVVQPEDGASTSWKSSSSYFQVEVVDPEPGAFLPRFVGETVVEITSDIDGFVCQDVSGYVTQTLFLCDRPELTPGDHVMTVTATDPFGATATTSLTVTIINQAPSATITLPEDDAVFYADQTIQFSGSAFDWDETIPDGNLSWSSSIDGELGTGGEITASLSQGEHVITLTATDSLGATGEDSVTVVVQAGAGVPSAIILEPDPQGAFYGPDTPITFVGQGTDPEDGTLPDENLSWSSDIDGFLGTGSTIEVPLSGPPPTPCENSVFHEVTLTATDSDGNQAQQTITIRVGRIC